MKSIELTQSQIKAKEAGATMFLFQISDYDLNRIDKGYSIGDSFPIEKGDKDILVQEDFETDDFNNIYYKHSTKPDNEDFIYFIGMFGDYEPYESKEYSWQPASQMTKEQSRYSFKECIDVRIVRVQDILISDCEKILNIYSAYFNVTNQKIRTAIINKFKAYYNQQMKEQNIDRTYENNDYVFLAEFA